MIPKLPTLNSPVEGILFDLDGTLMATSHDLCQALCTVLAEYNKPPVDLKDIEAIFSQGASEHIKLGFGISSDDPEFSTIKERFFSIYEARLKHNPNSPLYDGIRKLLNKLKEKKLPWGIVTNKHHRFADALVSHHKLNKSCLVLITPEDVSRGKPMPDSLLKAAKKIGCDPHRCIYIGDHERDILAGQRAGMLTIVAAWGYINDNDKPENWQPDVIANQPLDIIHWLDQST